MPGGARAPRSPKVMACQGCGGVSDKKLCCPTCVEFGRKSFFCNQDCFTKNWKSHAQLHDLLRKQKDMEEQSAAAEGAGDDGPASVDDAVESTVTSVSAPIAPVQRPAPAPPPSRPQEPVTSQRARPLAGGVSHLAGLPKRPAPGAGGAAAGLAKRASEGPDNANGNSPGADVVGNIVGRFQSMFAGPEGGKAAAEQRATLRGRGSSRERRGEPPVVGPGRGARGRSGSRDTRESKPSPSPAARGRFTAQNGLIALIIIIAVAGCAYFYVFQQADAAFNYDLQPDTVVIVADEAAASAAQVTQLPPGGINLQNPEDDVAHLGNVHELQAEISRLRDKVERHDKMLRYVMERYVEKSSLNIGNVEPEKQDDKLEAGQNFYVDASAPQLFVPHLENSNSSQAGLPSSDAELPNKQRRDHRRKGGLDAEPVGEFVDPGAEQDTPHEDVSSAEGYFSASEPEAGDGVEGGQLAESDLDMRGKRGSSQGLMQT